MIDHLNIVDVAGQTRRFRPLAVTPPPASNKVYGRVRHDGEMFPGQGRPDLNNAPASSLGLPEVHKMDTHKPMPEAFQWLWYRTFVRRLPMGFTLSMVVDELSDDDRQFLVEQKRMRASLRLMALTTTEEEAIQLFGVITRRNAFKTNQHACENGYANYVTGCNVGAKPLATEVIVTGGAYLELLDGDNTVNHIGLPCYRVPMLNMKKSVSVAEQLLADWDGVRQHPYIYFATTSRRGGAAYPLMGGLDIAVINVSDDDFAYMPAVEKDYIPVHDLIEVLPQGAPVPNPYFMWP